MKFTTIALSAAAILVASVTSLPVRRDVPENLVPEFGVQSGVNPTGTGDCDGIDGPNGQPIKIPCDCPPDRTSFIQKLNANVAAGHVLTNPTVQLSFPTDDSTASQLARLNAAAVTLQNLNGPGQGCPVAGTTFAAQNKAITDGTNASSPAPVVSTTAAAAPPAAATPAAASSTSGTASAAEVAALAPSLGFQSGVNPTGTGDCDGAVNDASGKPIKVPCACPPPQDQFIAALQANVAAGKAINNPTVAVSFPTDSSNQSLAARIEAALVTLQNLHGPGVGCPAASTTLSAQLKAAQS